MAPGATQPPPNGTPSPGAPTPSNNIDELVRIFLSRLGGNSPVQPGSAKGGVLTPVNAALGKTIGGLLDGKKSALGIFGALIGALLMPGSADPGNPADTASALGALFPTIIGTLGTGIAPILLPISIAMLAWGVLGKLDKYERAKLGE
jgi:peptidoglycan L-alanyl-D-glutamate endopeptidase CwlK